MLAICRARSSNCQVYLAPRSRTKLQFLSNFVAVATVVVSFPPLPFVELMSTGNIHSIMCQLQAWSLHTQTHTHTHGLDAMPTYRLCHRPFRMQSRQAHHETTMPGSHRTLCTCHCCSAWSRSTGGYVHCYTSLAAARSTTIRYYHA